MRSNRLRDSVCSITWRAVIAQEREPLVQQLAELHQHDTMTSMVRDLLARH